MILHIRASMKIMHATATITNTATAAAAITTTMVSVLISDLLRCQSR